MASASAADGAAAAKHVAADADADAAASADPEPAPNGDAHDDDDDHDHEGCVYNAVLDGVSADELRRILEQYASAGDGAGSPQARDARRAVALNFRGPGWERAGRDEGSGGPVPALYVAHCDGRADLVRVLLEAGADVAAAFTPGVTAFAIAIHHDLADIVREELRSGRHKVDEWLRYEYNCPIEEPYPEEQPGYVGFRRNSCRAIHLAVASFSYSWPRNESLHARLSALDVLVHEFGAKVNARDCDFMTPLHWVALIGHFLPNAERAVRALVALGADLEARGGDGSTPLIYAAHGCERIVPLLLSMGASANRADFIGYTPLTVACSFPEDAYTSTNVPLLLRASSLQTRRIVLTGQRRRKNCWSALDCLLERTDTSPPWCRDAILELMRSGVSVHPDNMPHAARFCARLARRAAARERGPPSWRTHDRMVQLAFDMEERGWIEQGVRRREARVAELERLLREAGIGSSSEESDSDSDDEESSGGDDEGIGGGGGGEEAGGGSKEGGS